MILVASQRGGGQNLAAHLLRTDENEHVEVHDLTGFSSDDLHEAFKEAEAISRATKCKQYLFSLSLNPPEGVQVSISEFEDTIERIENRLGLQGQPRATVFHEKEARRHCHVVWSRIDGETLTAKQMSFFKMKLQAISRELYLEHDWKMPRGLVDSAVRDPRNFTLAEWQQSKRSSIDPRTFKAAIQELWKRSDSARAFQASLNDRGLQLARGDRRGHVIVDHKGEVWSVATVLALKAKEVRQRLGDPIAYPSVADAKRELSDRLAPAVSRHLIEARLRFRERSKALNHQRQGMAQQHRAQRGDLNRKHDVRASAEAQARARQLPKGLSGIWSRLTGSYGELKRRHAHEASLCAQRDRKERDTLTASQLNERQRLQNAIKAHRKAQAELLWSLRGERHHLGRLADRRRNTRPYRRTMQ